MRIEAEETGSAMMPNSSDAQSNQLALQRESYHRTQQPTVANVASNERAVIDQQDLEGSDGTLRQALRLWNARQGPVIYNQWMSAFFAMTRDFKMEDTDRPPEETQSAKQKRISAMFHEIQTELHGPDHLVQAFKTDAGKKF